MAIDLSAVSGMTPSGLAVPGYIEEEIKQTRRLREEQELVAAAIRGAAAATGAGASGFSAMGEAIGSVSKLLNSLQGQFGATVKDATELSFSLQAVSGSAPNDIMALSASLEISSGKAKAATNDVLGLGAAFGALKGHIAKNIGDWALQGVEKLVDVQREFDKLNTTMVAATGSSANAAREFEWLRQFAMDTPVSLAEVTQGFVKMKAAGLDPTQEAMTSFSNVATATGVDFGKMIDAVTDATDGKFSGLEQLGISAKKEGDNVALTFQGVTTTVKNSSDEIVGYIEKIGNTTFDGATARHAQTLDGALSKLSNTWDELFRAINEGDVGTLIFDSVTLANGVLRDAVAILRAVGGAAGDTGKDLGALSAIQSGIATVFETVAVLGTNVKYVLVTIGNEIGGLVAQIAQGAQAVGRFLKGDFTGAKESAAAFSEIRRQMVADAEAARKEVDATTARIVNARSVVKESSPPPSNPASNTPPSSTPHPGGANDGAGSSSTTPAKPATPQAVAAAVRGDPAVCCCDNKAGPVPSAQTATAQPSQQQQPQGKSAAAAPAPGQVDDKAAAKAAVVAVASSSSSSSLNVVIPPVKAPATPAGKPEAVVDEYAKATEEIRKQTAELTKQRETLQASIDTLGKSEIAVAKLNVQQTKERLNAAATPGSEDHQPDRIDALQKLLAEQQETANTKEEADYKKRGYALKEQIEQSRENNALVQQEINLTGLSQLERSKIAALRTIEVRKAKELKEIEKSDHTAPRKQELSDQVREKSRIDAETEVQKLVQADWQKTADQINNSLTDAFMKSLESGKDFGKNLGNALKEQFKNLVLKPTISAIMSPISGVLSSAFSGLVNSGAGAAVQAVAGGGGASGLGTLASGASLLGSVGGAFSSGLSMTLAGGMGTALEGGLAMLGSSTGLSSALAGFGQLAGALGPIGLAIAALLAISQTTKGEIRTGGQFGIAYEGSVTNQRRGQTYTYEGQQYDRDFSNGEKKALVNGQAYRLEGDPVSDESTIKKAITGTATSINDLLKMYGSRSTLTSFSAGFETSGKSRGGVFAGGILSTGERFGESGQGDNYSQTLYELTSTNSPDFKTAVENFTTDLQQATLQALKSATDLPKYVSRQLKDVDIEALGATETTALLSKIGDLPNQLLQGFGTSRDALVQQFVQGLAGGDAAAAGETVANTLVASIEQTLFTTAAGRIFDTVNAGIIAPMLDAITTGANISEVLSQESIDRTIARAQEQAEAVTLLFNSPDFVAAMERIRTAVGGALGQAGSGVNYTPRYQQAAAAATQATGELGNAVSELAQQFNSAVSSLSSDAKSLQIDLLRAQGKMSEADALERDNYLKPFEKLSASDYATLATQYDANEATRRAIDAQNERNGLQDELNALTDDATRALTRQRDALDESNRALFDNVQAVKLQKTLAQELPGVLDKYMLPAQRRKAQYDSVAKDLTAAGIGVTADQLANASKGEFAAAAVAVYNLGSTTDDMRLALVRAAGVMADIKDAEVDEALANLQRVVGLQQEIATKTRDDIKAVFDLLQSSVDELYSEVDSTARMRAAEGQDYIAKTLALAQSGEKILDSTELGKAISAARSGLDGTQYTSQFERDKERLVLAGKLSDLEEISGEQLSEAERQVKYLDDLVKDGQTQIDELRGINGGVGDVAGAVQALAEAISGRNTVASTPTVSNRLTGSGQASFDKATGKGTTSSGVYFERESIADAARAVLTASPDGSGAMSIYNALKEGGYKLSQYNEMFGMPAGTLEAEAQKLGMKVFHRGTPFVPNTGFALLQRGEAVIPTAYNPFVHGRSLGDTARLEAHLEKLTDEVMRLQSLQTLGNTHAQATVELLDNVTEGGNGMRAEIMNKVEFVA